MRDIKFKGFHPDENGKEKVYVNGKWIKGYWVEGSLVAFDEENVFILPAKYGASTLSFTQLFRGMAEYVIPETVSQYTGLKDNDGKEIYENDILKSIYLSGYSGIPNKDFGIGVVEYCDTYYGGAAYQINTIGEIGNRVFSASLKTTIIGNIFSNPELIGGDKE